ncbi:hypothetical protein OH77DRAFT_1594590 [Trametes cingulata]|nr:hypothetical protein OH77DRAFT_1594590 [Trametes cingulata]
MDVFHFALARDAESAGARGRSTLAPILNGSPCVLAGFGMARLALHLHRRTGLHVEGVDLATLSAVSGSTKPQTAAEFAEKRIHPDVARNRIHALWYEDSMENLCLGAWLSAILAESAFNDVCRAQKVHTSNLPDTHLECLSRLVRNVELLVAEQPTQVDSEIESVETSVIVETTHGESIIGKAVSAVGKQNGIRVPTGGGNFRSIERIRVVGREERTHAEACRGRARRREEDEPLVIVHGAPHRHLTLILREDTSTGHEEDDDDRGGARRVGGGRAPKWVVAQSNIGVKIIARTLVKKGVDFRLLVSKEFYVDW